MVYSSVPINISFSSMDVSLEDDDSLSISSAEHQELENIPSKTRTHDPLNVDRWNPDMYLFRHQIEHHHEPKTTKSNSALQTQLQDIGYPHDEKENSSYGGRQVMDRKTQRPPRKRFSRRASFHSRMEALQHQLGKPFRRLSLGKRILISNASLDCFGNGVLDTVHRPRTLAITNDDGDEEHSLSQATERSPEQEDDNTTSMISAEETTTAFEAYPNSTRVQEHQAIASQESHRDNEQYDLRWLYARSFWPVDAGFASSPSRDPPGHLH